MNRIYKVVWSRARQCYVVASEFARRHTKGGQLKKLLAAFFAAGIAVTAGGMAAAAGEHNHNYGSTTDTTGNTIKGTTDYTIVWGQDNTVNAVGDDITVWGTENTVKTTEADFKDTAYRATVWGFDNTVSEDGFDTTTSDLGTRDHGGYMATVWGGHNEVYGRYSTAWGYRNYVGKGSRLTTTFGQGNENYGSNTTAIGYQNKVGNEVKNSLVAGSGSQIGANFEDLSAGNTASEGSIGSAIALGYQTQVTAGNGAAAIGNQSVASGSGAAAIGYISSATGEGASAIGNRTTASGKGAVVLGYASDATAEGAAAIGSAAIASGAGSAAVGSNSRAAGSESFAAGGGTAEANYGVAIGWGAQSTIANGVALGGGSVTTANAGKTGYLAEGSGAEWRSTNAALAVGNGSSVTRQITGLAAGTEATDAVNVAQLKVVNDKSIEDASLSGGTLTLVRESGETVKVSGFITESDLAGQKLTYKSNGKNARQVAITEGLNFVDGENTTVTTADSGYVQVNVATDTVKDIAKDAVTVSGGKNIEVSGTDGKYSVALKDNVTLGTEQVNRIHIDGENGSITVGAEANAVKVTKDGISAGGKTVTNVGAGNISATSTDAVNGSQLYEVEQKIKDDPLYFKGDAGSTASKKLGDTLRLEGGVSDASKLSDGNVGVVVNDDGVIRVKLAKDLKGLDTVSATNMYVTNVDDSETAVVNKKYLTEAVTKVDGKHTTVTNTDGNLTLTKTDATDTEGANYDIGLGDSVTLGGADADGSLTLENKSGAKAKIIVNGSGASNAGSTDAVTRLEYRDAADKLHTVATMDDGISFAGDDGTASKKLGDTLRLEGGVSDASKLSDGNVGVVVNDDGVIRVKLAKDLKGLDTVSATNMYVTNVDDSETAVVNKKYLTEAITKVDGKHTTVTNTDGNLTLTKTDATDTAGDNYEIGLADTVTIGSEEGKKITLDGAAGNLSAGGVTVGSQTAKIDGTSYSETGDYVTGLDNKTWNKDAISSGRAATEDQLAAAEAEITNNFTAEIGGKTFGLTGGDSGDAAVTSTLDGTILVKGANGLTSNVKDGDDGKYLEIGLSKDITVGTAGKDGKDGEAGSIGIAGKDGKDGISTTTIRTEYRSGKDGSNGRDGAPGKDGIPGLDGVDGRDGITRIIYETPEGDKEQVATLDDGLYFRGDDGKSIAKTLNTTLDIKGGADTSNLSDGNIGIVANEDGSLGVKLSKDVTGLTKVESTNMYVTNVDESSGDSVTNKTYVDKTVADSAWKLAVNGDAETASDVKQGTVVDFTGANGIEISKDGTNITAGIGRTLTTAGGVTVGEQKIVTKSEKDEDGNDIEVSQTGNYVTGLDNTEWKENSVVEDRAATEGQLRDVSRSLSDSIGRGLNFAGDTGMVNKQLGDTVNIKGDENITTAVDENGDILVKLNKELTVETVNANTFKAGDNVTLDGEGLTVGGGEGTSPITIKQGNVSFGGNVISNVGDGKEATDAATVGQLDKAIADAKASDRHLAAGSYAVGDFTDAEGKKTGQGVSIAIVDNAGKTADADGNAYGSVTITDMAKASDLGEVSGLDKDLLNVKKDADGNVVTDENGDPVTDHTTAVDAINNLNKKVGDLKYGDVEGTEIADGDSTTDAIGKLDNRMDDMDKTIDGLSKNHTEVKAGNGIKVTDENAEADGVNGKHVYKVELTPEVTLGEAADAEAGTEGTDGKLTVTGKDGNAVTVDGASGTVSGLTNKTWDTSKLEKYMDSSNAATESQLHQAMAGAVQYDRNEDGSVNTAKVTLADNGGKGTTLTNVADGNVAEGSKDAVNGGQLYATNQAVINNSQNIQNLGSAVDKLDDRVKRVGAGAAALAALHPLDFDPDAKWDFAAGFGNYRSASAAAVGAYYRPNEDVMLSIGGSMGGGENMFNAGVSLKLGAGHSNVSTSKVAMAKEIKMLREDLEKLKGAFLDVNSGRTLDLSKLAMFPDIPENHWAYEYIAVLAGNGIIEGYPDGNFGGDRQMTRYEFATLLCRAMLKGAKLSDRILAEFAPELEYFKVITVERDDKGNPIIRRVRTIRENEMK